jgi:hypothetical protein
MNLENVLVPLDMLLNGDVAVIDWEKRLVTLEIESYT